jgi:hypothetical protein
VLDEAVKAAKREFKAATGLVLKDDLKAKQRVLRRLGCGPPFSGIWLSNLIRHCPILICAVVLTAQCCG